MDIPGMQRPELQAIPQIKEKLTFLYLERCVINRQDSAITVTDNRGTVLVPSAALCVFMLGPGSKITHRAMELIGDMGASVIWVGERGVRYYAHGRPLTHSSHLLIRQAELVSNVRNRVMVARVMYQMRFPDEDVSAMSMQQLRGREGARVRAVYRRCSKTTGVAWDKRTYDSDNYDDGTPINQALSAAHTCLYGVAHSVIVAMGCSPGLGFVHTGHERSFVFDFADLYKAQYSIPIAFATAAERPEDIGRAVRLRMRDAFADGHILENMVRDLRKLLLTDMEIEEEPDVDVVHLWDDRAGELKSGVSYQEYEQGEFQDKEEEPALEGYGTLVEDRQ